MKVNNFKVAMVFAVIVSFVYMFTHNLVPSAFVGIGRLVSLCGEWVVCPYYEFARELASDSGFTNEVLWTAYPLYALSVEQNLVDDAMKEMGGLSSYNALYGNVRTDGDGSLASNATSDGNGNSASNATSDGNGNSASNATSDGNGNSASNATSNGSGDSSSNDIPDGNGSSSLNGAPNVKEAASQDTGGGPALAGASQDTGGEPALATASAGIMNGDVYPMASLTSFDFLYKNFYTVTSITELTSEKLRPTEFLAKDMTIAHDSTTPQILIFHTHSQEEFADSVSGDDTTTIVGVGDYLARLLTENYGYNVIHDRGIYDVIDGRLDRSKAYTYAEEAVEEILDKYPSIDMVIDLHRDGVSEDTRLVTEINGKQTAKVMFFNGLSYSKKNGEISYLPNPNLDDNLALSLQMQLLGNAYYPDFLRRIYVNAYRYCLHLRGKSMLIEAGAQNNTLQEVKNAMEPLADLIDKTLRGEKYWD